MHRKPGELSSRRRAGFTLVEVLLSLALSVVLMLAVTAAIDVYRQMNSAGQDDLNEARLVRSVIATIEHDLRSVIPPEPPTAQAGITQGSATGGTAAGSTGSSTSGSSSTGSTSSQTSGSSSSGTTSGTGESAEDQLVSNVTTDSAYSKKAFGVTGDSQSLMINALRPQRAVQINPDQPVMTLAEMQSDARTIYYFLAGTGQTDVQGVTVTPAANVAWPVASNEMGLARMEGDRLMFAYAQEQGGRTPLLAQVIAPEVTSILFRYFDGTAWQASWNGATMQALPTSIEITLVVNVPDRSAKKLAGSSDFILHSYRHVVMLPTGKAAAGAAPTGTGTTP